MFHSEGRSAKLLLGRTAMNELGFWNHAAAAPRKRRRDRAGRNRAHVSASCSAPRISWSTACARTGLSPATASRWRCRTGAPVLELFMAVAQAGLVSGADQLAPDRARDRLHPARLGGQSLRRHRRGSPTCCVRRRRRGRAARERALRARRDSGVSRVRRAQARPAETPSDRTRGGRADDVHLGHDRQPQGRPPQAAARVARAGVVAAGAVSGAVRHVCRAARACTWSARRSTTRRCSTSPPTTCTSATPWC